MNSSEIASSMSNPTQLTVELLVKNWLSSVATHCQNKYVTAQLMYDEEANSYSIGELEYSRALVKAVSDIYTKVPKTWSALLVRNPNPAKAVQEAVEHWTRSEAQERTVNDEARDGRETYPGRYRRGGRQAAARLRIADERDVPAPVSDGGGDTGPNHGD